MALIQVSKVDKKQKPSKLEVFAKGLDIASSLGSLVGNDEKGLLKLFAKKKKGE